MIVLFEFRDIYFFQERKIPLFHSIIFFIIEMKSICWMCFIKKNLYIWEMFLYFLTDLHYLDLDSAGRRYKSHCPDEPRNAGWKHICWSDGPPLWWITEHSALIGGLMGHPFPPLLSSWELLILETFHWLSGSGLLWEKRTHHGPQMWNYFIQK